MTEMRGEIIRPADPRERDHHIYRWESPPSILTHWGMLQAL